MAGKPTCMEANAEMRKKAEITQGDPIRRVEQEVNNRKPLKILRTSMVWLVVIFKNKT